MNYKERKSDFIKKSMANNLKEYGFDEFFEKASLNYPNMYVGRVASQSKGIYKVITGESILYGEISGKFNYESTKIIDYPAVGDFVMLDRDTNQNGNAIIHKVLPRKSIFVRMASGTANKQQVLATNIDYVFICMSLNLDFNLKRLERYITLTWNSGAIPVIVLTKSDLCNDIEKSLAAVKAVASGADILLTSSINECGLEELEPFLKEGKTIALVGSSGVGKTTLINRLLGEEKLETRALRNDDKGRHTTTTREMYLLPCGSIVIDTPGMRELGLTGDVESFSKSFDDIDEYFNHCKFRNCTHTSEPGCAIIKAIEDGELSEKRWSSYNKLKQEAEFAKDKESYLRKKNAFFKEIAKKNK